MFGKALLSQCFPFRFRGTKGHRGKGKSHTVKCTLCGGSMERGHREIYRSAFSPVPSCGCIVPCEEDDTVLHSNEEFQGLSKPSIKHG